MPLFDMDPNTAQNLTDFGFATMAAAQQPGAHTLGAIGQGGIGMNQAALQRAQTQDIQSQAQSRQLQNQLLPYQMLKLKNEAKLFGSLTDDEPGDNPNSPPPNAGGQPWSPPLGSPAPSKQSSARPVNNPGNLRPVGSSTGFQTFDTPQAGMDAMRSDLLAKIGGSASMNGQPASLRNIIYTYAPPNENNSAAYLENVSKQSGISPNKILTPEDIDKILPFMVKQEGNGAMLTDNQQAQRNLGQGIPKPTKREMAMGLLGMPQLAAEQYKAETAGPVTAAQEAEKVKSAAPLKEAEKTGESAGEAKKTYASITSRIDNAKKIISEMKALSKNMPDRGPYDAQVWGSKHLGNQKLEASVKSFENLNENLFTQELPGVIPPGSKLDIPIVNALQKASKVDPHDSHTARLKVLGNLESILDKAKENAAKNYGILSGTEVPTAENTVAAAEPMKVTHKWTPQGIVPIGEP